MVTYMIHICTYMYCIYTHPCKVSLHIFYTVYTCMSASNRYPKSTSYTWRTLKSFIMHDWMFLLVKSMPQPHYEWPRLLYSAPSALRRVRETLTTFASCIFYCKLGMVRIFLVWRCASRIVESCLIWCHLFLGPAPTWSHTWPVGFWGRRVQRAICSEQKLWPVDGLHRWVANKDKNTIETNTCCILDTT